jgi:hypothetical protein
MNNRQRSTKAERQAAESVLRGLWEKAFKEGEVSVDFGEGVPDAEHKAKILHQALGDFRKKIRKKQTENFDLFMMINACSILREGETGVMIKRKPGRFSDRTQTILDVISINPELGLGPKTVPVDSLGLANIASIAAQFEIDV